MPKGLMIPLSVDEKGNAKLIDGVEFIKQTILTSLRDCESRNPFQDLGLGNRMIFDINDNVATSWIIIRIEEIFAKLEAQELAKLGTDSTQNSITFNEEKEGELSVTIQYIDLEVDKPEEIILTFS